MTGVQGIADESIEDALLDGGKDAAGERYDDILEAPNYATNVLLWCPLGFLCCFPCVLAYLPAPTAHCC